MDEQKLQELKNEAVRIAEIAPDNAYATRRLADLVWDVLDALGAKS